VAERVLEEGELIEGQEREVTVMILDVCDFTEFAERSSARETVTFLNDLLGIAVPCVTEHGGQANKFLGDGLLAVFGAPERLSDHADRAVAAAREIAAKLGEHFGDEVRFGVGVNSGPVVVGSVGERRGARGAPDARDRRRDPHHRGDSLSIGSGPNH
jgi:class 3 adenylate cyclase